MTTTKEQFAEMILDAMSEDDIQRIFGISAEELAGDGWNQSLEFHYNVYVAEEQHEQEQE